MSNDSASPSDTTENSAYPLHDENYESFTVTHIGKPGVDGGRGTFGEKIFAKCKCEECMEYSDRFGHEAIVHCDELEGFYCDGCCDHMGIDVVTGALV